MMMVLTGIVPPYNSGITGQHFALIRRETALPMLEQVIRLIVEGKGKPISLALLVVVLALKPGDGYTRGGGESILKRTMFGFFFISSYSAETSQNGEKQQR
jgi:hypothetical protein